MSAANGESSDDCSSLKQCNHQIKLLCTEINGLVDLDFELAHKANELERLSATRLLYAKAANEYHIGLMQFRDRHLNAAVNYQNKPGRAIKSLGRLYNQLRKQNPTATDSAHSSTSSEGVQQWGIPLLSKLPQPVLPKDAAAQSSFALNLSRSLFKGRQHYFAYNHLKLSHAKRHLDTLRETLVLQRAHQADRQERAALLDNHLLSTKNEITKYKEELNSDKGLAIWQQSYELYRDIVRKFLEMIANSGREISCDNEPDLFEVESPPATTRNRLRFGFSRSGSNLMAPELRKNSTESSPSDKSMVTAASENVDETKLSAEASVDPQASPATVVGTGAPEGLNNTALAVSCS